MRGHIREARHCGDAAADEPPYAMPSTGSSNSGDGWKPSPHEREDNQRDQRPAHARGREHQQQLRSIHPGGEMEERLLDRQRDEAAPAIPAKNAAMT